MHITHQKPTGSFIAASWTALLLTVGLWNATLADSEKGFYAMSFLLALFGSIAVQKNIRDLASFRRDELTEEEDSAVL